MTDAEFNRLVEQYFDRSATAAEVARLREGLLASPELQRRFRQREKLYQVQVKCLADVGRQSQTWIQAWLLGFAQRFNRHASGLCLLALVLVQTRVTLDADYRGLNLYVLDSISVYDEGEYDDMEAGGGMDFVVDEAKPLEVGDEEWVDFVEE